MPPNNRGRLPAGGACGTPRGDFSRTTDSTFLGCAQGLEAMSFHRGTSTIRSTGASGRRTKRTPGLSQRTRSASSAQRSAARHLPFSTSNFISASSCPSANQAAMVAAHRTASSEKSAPKSTSTTRSATLPPPPAICQPTASPTPAVTSCSIGRLSAGPSYFEAQTTMESTKQHGSTSTTAARPIPLSILANMKLVMAPRTVPNSSAALPHDALDTS